MRTFSDALYGQFVFVHRLRGQNRRTVAGIHAYTRVVWKSRGAPGFVNEETPPAEAHFLAFLRQGRLGTFRSSALEPTRAPPRQRWSALLTLPALLSSATC